MVFFDAFALSLTDCRKLLNFISPFKKHNVYVYYKQIAYCIQYHYIIFIKIISNEENSRDIIRKKEEKGNNMKIVGLVTEYNPFHNGHEYHIRKAKEITGADYCITVMSGNYVQRGEPSIVDKWIRTKMALVSGVDVVVELPTIHAASSAEFFALNSVRLLDKMNVIHSLCFGSEIGNLQGLQIIAQILCDEPSSYISYLQTRLSLGESYPKARSQALVKYLNEQNHLNFNLEDVIQVLSSPNNILGIEYLKALIRTQSKIIPYTIQRIGPGYHAQELQHNYSSATAVRNTIKDPFSISKVKNIIPEKAYSVLRDALSLKRGPNELNLYSQALHYRLMQLNTEDLTQYPEISEGLENRIIEAAKNYVPISDLINAVKTKRYTYTRIQRSLLYILLGIKQDEFNKYNRYVGPPYVRILGFRQEASPILKYIKEHSELPLLTNVKKEYSSLSKEGNELLDKEIFWTDLYSMAVKNFSFHRKGNEFREPIVII